MNKVLNLLIFIIIGFFLSCTNENNLISTENLPSNSQKVKYKKLDKLFIIGDFDGDNKTDTIYQNNISRLDKLPIDSSPDPFATEWDTVMHFFSTKESDVIFYLSRQKGDTIHLGNGIGLYCLINIGDNNNDGSDEIALAVDRADYSNLNDCIIFSFYNNKWHELKRFAIHEDAFYYESDSIDVFKEIKGYLEHKGDKWMFRDYNEQFKDIQPGNNEMKVLKIERD
jgi:hypothetical protein